MNRLTLAALAVLAGSVTAPACLSGQAHAGEVPGLPNCGGNAQGVGNNPTVPWTCGNAKTIAGVVGGPVQGILTVSNGTGTAAVTVQVTLPAPQAFDVTLAGFWHRGKSTGPETARSSGVIPAGALTATVTTTRTGICDGQFDFQVNKPAGVGQSDLYRLHGPWLTVPDCMGIQIVPPPPASSIPVPPTAPPANTPGAPSPGPGASTPNRIPDTGAGDTAGRVIVALFMVAIGGAGVVVRRRGAS